MRVFQHNGHGRNTFASVHMDFMDWNPFYIFFFYPNECKCVQGLNIRLVGVTFTPILFKRVGSNHSLITFESVNKIL